MGDPTATEAALIAAVDSLLPGDIEIYTTETSMVRSGTCWAASIDLSCCSAKMVGQDAVTHYRDFGVTLISPRHVIGVAHWNAAVGAVYYFVDMEGNASSRTLSAVAFLANDIWIGALDSDVPAGVTFARILPEDYATYLDGDHRLPAIFLNQFREAAIYDIIDLDYSGYVYPVVPLPEGDRFDYFRQAIAHDSGHSVMLIAGTVPILTHCVSYYGGGGSSVWVNRGIINAAMTSLGGGYQLTPFDLSSL